MDGKCLFNSVSQSNSLTMKDKLGERAIDLHKQTNKCTRREQHKSNQPPGGERHHRPLWQFQFFAAFNELSGNLICPAPWKLPLWTLPYCTWMPNFALMNTNGRQTICFLSATLTLSQSFLCCLWIELMNDILCYHLIISPTTTPEPTVIHWSYTGNQITIHQARGGIGSTWSSLCFWLAGGL